MTRTEIKHELKIRYGLPSGGPTDAELNAVVDHLKKLQRPFTNEDVRSAVERHCAGYNTYRYLSDSHADLIAALKLLMAK